MEYVVVSVYDTAIGAFGRPVFVRAVGEAIRSFQDEVNKEEDGNAIAHHPGDYQLFKVAVFDDQSGRFLSEGAPERIADASSLKFKKEA